MDQVPESAPQSRPSTPPAPVRGMLCPYCGVVSPDMRRCSSCRGHFDPLSRQATQNAMGPWFVRDEAHPFRPGCSYETLVGMVRRGVVTGETVLRGPATRQLWSIAVRTPGVAHLLGSCHACGAVAGSAEESCGRCGASFVVDRDRQHLGLSPVHLLPGRAPADVVAGAMGPAPVPPPARPRRGLGPALVAAGSIGLGGLGFGLWAISRGVPGSAPAPIARPATSPVVVTAPVGGPAAEPRPTPAVAETPVAASTPPGGAAAAVPPAEPAAAPQPASVPTATTPAPAPDAAGLAALEARRDRLRRGAILP